LVGFDVFVLAVFLAAGLAELPQGFLAAQPPFCAMVFTSFHDSFGFCNIFCLEKQTRDVIKRAWLLLDKIVSMFDK
jgi:hypothetical protein